MENNAPLVSVIVPVYNCEKTLERCIESLLSQSYSNIEIICVNDGSSDSSCQILEKFQKSDKRLRVINNPKNMGIAYSRNVGLKSVNGEYIMWCDSDDWYEPDMCLMMSSALTDLNVDIACCSENIIDNDNLKYRFVLENVNNISQQFVGRFAMDANVYKCINRVLWNKIFKKSIIDKYNIDFPDVVYAEDNSFVLKYLSKTQYIFCFDERLYNYVRSEDSTYGKIITSKMPDCLRALNDVSNFLHKHKLKQYYDAINDIYYTETLSLFEIWKRYLNIRVEMFYNTLPLKYNPKLPQNKTKSTFETKIKTENNEVKVYEIFLAVDENYVEQMVVCLTSILVNSFAWESFNFYILYAELSQKSMDDIRLVLQIKNCNIEFIKLDNSKIYNLPLVRNLSRAVYFRYEIPNIKPELDKCLYLDCDIVVEKSLDELYNSDLSGVFCAAVKNSSEWFRKIKNSLFNCDNYFNAGIILFNLQQMKNCGITTEYLYSITNRLSRMIDLQDQDILNIVFRNMVNFIAPKFNVQYPIFYKSEHYLYDAELIDEARNYPVIIHYADDIKPWMRNCRHPLAHRYFHYLRLSPLKKNIEKYKDIFFGLDD